MHSVAWVSCFSSAQWRGIWTPNFFHQWNTQIKTGVTLWKGSLYHTPKVAYLDMNSGLLHIFWCWNCRDLRRPSRSQFCVQIYYCNWEPDAKVCCRWFLDHILPSVWASLRSPSSSSFHLLTDLALDNPPPEVLGAWEWIRFGARVWSRSLCLHWHAVIIDDV